MSSHLFLFIIYLSFLFLYLFSYKTSDIDWDEFWNVIKGNGPCNAQRLKHHKKAHDDGAWVREAAAAYGKKQMELVG